MTFDDVSNNTICESFAAMRWWSRELATDLGLLSADWGATVLSTREMLIWGECGTELSRMTGIAAELRDWLSLSGLAEAGFGSYPLAGLAAGDLWVMIVLGRDKGEGVLDREGLWEQIESIEEWLDDRHARAGEVRTARPGKGRRRPASPPPPREPLSPEAAKRAREVAAVITRVAAEGIAMPAPISTAPAGPENEKVGPFE